MNMNETKQNWFQLVPQTHTHKLAALPVAEHFNLRTRMKTSTDQFSVHPPKYLFQSVRNIIKIAIFGKNLRIHMHTKLCDFFNITSFGPDNGVYSRRLCCFGCTFRQTIM